MSAFVNPNLLWGLALVSLPVLIHLINLLRHRRVEWAAMEFLLASQRKNSNWIRLKELLLLLLRMAAVAAVVLLLAQPLLKNQLGRLLGGARTHHIVLLDDSFSMSDRWADTSAFDQARRVVERLGEQAAGQPTLQTFTLVRFSRAGRQGGTQADLLEQTVNRQFGRQLQQVLSSMRPTQLSVGAGPALEAVEQVLKEDQGENRVVYIVSDFRATDWNEPGDVARALERLSESRAQIRLVQCVDQARPNLVIADLEPARATRAAGVPLVMQLTVKNFGSDVVQEVAVLLEEDGRARPALTIDRIAPGLSETRRFTAFFDTAGDHTITARLESDAVAADNVRHALVSLPLAVPVLIVDGNADATHGRFLSTALAPGGAVKTGIAPRLETPTYLNSNPLDEFGAVYLLDIEHLDQPAIEALENYVRGGGGVAFFVGEQTRGTFYNARLYRDGQGLFPLPLVAKTQLLVDRLETGADLQVAAEHPVFRVFAGERNSFLSAVTVDWYLSAPQTWQPPADSTTRILARLRNGAPLAVEQQYGSGRVVAFLTTAAPVWNNWGRNPSFVVAALELQAWLADRPTNDAQRRVGSPIRLRLDPGRYRPQVRLLMPADEAWQRQRGSVAGEPSALTTDATPGKDGLVAFFPDTPTSGFYQLELTTAENRTETRRLAFNVEADEGNLATLGGDDLASRLKGVDYVYRQAVDFQLPAHEIAGSNLGQWILYLLVGLLVGEQALAYAASYHLPGREAAR